VSRKLPLLGWRKDLHLLLKKLSLLRVQSPLVLQDVYQICDPGSGAFSSHEMIVLTYKTSVSKALLFLEGLGNDFWMPFQKSGKECCKIWQLAIY
jgi:hypothetical protein